MVVAPKLTTGPRELTLNHLTRIVTEARGLKLDDDPEPLEPNHMRLFSYYKPSLEAGPYTIEAVQQVETTHPKYDKESMLIYNYKEKDTKKTPVPQSFNVVAPQFAIDPKLINSYYPPDGHQDEARVLPHIVFNDPHVPWERDAGFTIHGERDPDLDANGQPVKDANGDVINRSMVPWLAVLVFDPSELKLEASDCKTLKIPGWDNPDADEIKLMTGKMNPNGTFPMTIKDYLGLNKSSRINYEANYGDLKTNQQWQDLTASPDPMTAIFPKKGIFFGLFANTKTGGHNIESFKYMSHVREINTIGFPDAGVEANGLFSIIVSHRTGNYNITQPTTQICHLVSLENIDSTWGSVKDTISANPMSNERIGMVSLYSWIYTALPPNPVNFVDTMTKLLKANQMLRAPDTILDMLQDAEKSKPYSKNSKAKDQVIARLKLGYTMARWRAETGEETAAFNRGPLVPQPIPWPPVGDWAGASNTSKEYQTLDLKTGLMDLSYSSAWQLGKLLAIADSAFNQALMRFRSLVHEKSSSKARKQVNLVADMKAAIKNLAAGVPAINNATADLNTEPRRVQPLRNETDITNLADVVLKHQFIKNVASNVEFQGSAGQEIYDEFNKRGANNSDWATIFTWLSEKLFLTDIPAHFLIPDPSYLPNEALRFFYIDDAWLDSLIDGALSVANHLDGDDDVVRLQIKQAYNVYLSKTVTDTKTKPQIPCSGFILRSQLVKAMPDLRITVTWKIPDDTRKSVCRYTKLDDMTILCLLDRMPEELDNITLAQPPHQQRFSLGNSLNPETKVLDFQLRQLFTKTKRTEEEWPRVDNATQEKIKKKIGVDGTNWFNWNSRCMNVQQMATDINDCLQTGTQLDDEYSDLVPTSSILGLELNDPAYYFVITPNVPDLSIPARSRQIWTGLPKPPKSPGQNIPAGSSSSGPSTGPVLKPIPSPVPPVPAPSVPPSKITSTITIKDQTLAQASSGRTIGATTLQRRFTVQIYPDYKGPPPTTGKPNIWHEAAYIPTLNTYFYDLIISIRKIPNFGDSSYRLKEIGIEIPTTGIYDTTKDSKVKPEALLDTAYDGPGIRMLSNPRFVPYINSLKDYMQIRLIPRSALSDPVLVLNDARSAEAGFRLAEANVCPVNAERAANVIVQGNDGRQRVEKRGVVSVGVYERYAGPNGQDVYVKSQVLVAKWEGEDSGM